MQFQTTLCSKILPLGVDTFWVESVNNSRLSLWGFAINLRCRHFVDTSSVRCRHWILNLCQVSTLDFLDLNLCLLTSGVDTSVAGVNTSFSKFKSLAIVFRSRHFYSRCQHFLPRTCLFVFLVIWASITLQTLRCFPHKCVWSSVTSFWRHSWFSHSFA